MAFTSYWGLDFVILLTALLMTVYVYMTRNFKYWKNRGVVELSPIPFFGNFMKCIFLQKSPGVFLDELYERAKGLPYLGFYIVDKPCLLIRDRELVKSVLVKDFNNFIDRNSKPNSDDRIAYSNLFFLKNPAWRILRSKLTPFFTSGKLKKMFYLMLECSNNLETYLEALQVEGEGKIVDMKDMTAKFNTDVISSIAFGLNTNSLNDPNAEFRKFGKMALNFNYLRSFQMFSVFFLPTITRLTGIKMFGEKPSEFLRNTLWETINQRMKSKQKRNDLIDMLIEFKKLSDENDTFKLDGDDLVAQAVVFFVAGFETSSTVTGFSLYELALQPDIQNKMRKEIHDAFIQTDGEITYEMVNSLTYLDMIVSETMRMYPPLPFLDRVSNETCKLMDYDLVIEKGTPVYISMSGMHMDPQYFPNPKKYDPERFSEENKNSIPSCVYLPFGDGPRACIGTRLGLLQVKLALIVLFNKYEVVACEKTSIPMVLNHKAILVSPLEGGIHLTIRKIKD